MNVKFKEIDVKLNSLTDPQKKEITLYLKETYGIEHEDAVTPAGSVWRLVMEDSNVPTSVNLKLIHAGHMKLHVVKTVKEITGLGLKEAKDLVENSPSILKQGLSKTEAEAWQVRLQEFGATVEIIE